MGELSDEETCYSCGGVIDNDDGIGYCSACAADLGVYAQRAAQEAQKPQQLEEDGHLRLALVRLTAQVESVLERLSRVEGRLAELDGRSGACDQADASADFRAHGSVDVSPGRAGAAEASRASQGDRTDQPPPTLEQRARALGVDYARLRKIYSDDELAKLLEGRAEAE